LGIFLSRDALIRAPGDAPNLFVYALDNPLRYWDPYGFDERGFFARGGTWDKWLDVVYPVMAAGADVSADTAVGLTGLVTPLQPDVAGQFDANGEFKLRPALEDWAQRRSVAEAPSQAVSVIQGIGLEWGNFGLAVQKVDAYGITKNLLSGLRDTLGIVFGARGLFGGSAMVAEEAAGAKATQLVQMRPAGPVVTPKAASPAPPTALAVSTQAPDAVVGGGKALGSIENADVVYLTDPKGRTVFAEGRISGSHPGRGKGYRPEPPGGRAPGEHRGHLVPEGGVEEPDLVNVKPNIVSEAAGSNLGPKKVFDNRASRTADQNPGAVVRTEHEPSYPQDSTRPDSVKHRITINGKVVHEVDIPNK
jgi:hypothetical protein